MLSRLKREIFSETSKSQQLWRCTTNKAKVYLTLTTQGSQDIPIHCLLNYLTDYTKTRNTCTSDCNPHRWIKINTIVMQNRFDNWSDKGVFRSSYLEFKEITGSGIPKVAEIHTGQPPPPTFMVPVWCLVLCNWNVYTWHFTCLLVIRNKHTYIVKHTQQPKHLLDKLMKVELEVKVIW